jgi:hypothetical protein
MKIAMDAMEIHNQDNILDNDLMLINFRVKTILLNALFRTCRYKVFKKVPGWKRIRTLIVSFQTIQNHFSITSINTLIWNGNLTLTLEQANTSIGVFGRSQKK